MVNVLSFSGGKDSTALLLMMLEKNMPLDYIIFIDLTKEFPQIYKHIDKVEKYIGREITRIKVDWNYYFAEQPRPNGMIGNSFPFANRRWCTGLKKSAFQKFFQSINIKPREAIQYIGIAADEKKRLEKFKSRKENKLKVTPLAEWGITETQALEYCYSKGFDWDGLYNIVSRTGCYCCPFGSLKKLKKIWQYFPELWEDIKWLDSLPVSNKQPFRENYTLPQLEARFAQEIAQEKAFMKWMTGKEK